MRARRRFIHGERSRQPETRSGVRLRMSRRASWTNRGKNVRMCVRWPSSVISPYNVVMKNHSSGVTPGPAHSKSASSPSQRRTSASCWSSADRSNAFPYRRSSSATAAANRCKRIERFSGLGIIGTSSLGAAIRRKGNITRRFDSSTPRLLDSRSPLLEPCRLHAYRYRHRQGNRDRQHHRDQGVDILREADPHHRP